MRGTKDVRGTKDAAVVAMSIEIDDARFRQLLEVAGADRRFDRREIETVLATVQLAASVDLDDDPAEQTLLGTLTRRLCALGGLSVESIRPLSPIPMDGEERAARIAALAPQLVTSGARDLAFVLAYLLIVVDLELAPIESALLDGLQRGLAIPRARASELAEAAARIVTPPEQATEEAPEQPAPDAGVAASERNR